MHIIFEEHQYKAADVLDVLKEISSLEDVEKKISVSYVGYFYSPTLKDCVFILPKVLLTDKIITDDDGKDRLIEILANVPSKDGKDYITPEDVITPEGQEACLPKEYRKFLYEFSVWVYRALNVYRQQNPTSKAIYYKKLPQEGRGRKKQAETYLDIVLSLIRFNRENQNFFLTIVKNIHKGYNKINWAQTISKTPSIIQDDDVMYLHPVNKKRMQNFDEELFVIFFSILNYLNDTYGFRSPINLQYDLIKSKHFENYLHGRGKQRLKQIKYKYFSDKAMQLWDICYAFFDTAYKLNINAEQKEYLLAKKFNIVFEAMIDELIGEKDIPKGLKEQDDGKRVDHMYTYFGLTNSNDQKDEIYYIGDSKYYKVNHALGKESIYKQYTYARNVIQWNIDLFVNQDQSGWTEEEKKEYEEDKDKYKSIRLRDDVTEGYNIIPNFFISAFVDEKRNYIKEDNIVPHEQSQTHIAFQFKDRLFDRDTMILSHYDVNFLYILYLYARNKANEKATWKQHVRKKFREEIRKVLQKKFDFYAMKSRGNVLAGEQFIKEHFKELQGKIYRPYDNENLYALALEKQVGESTEKSETFSLLQEFFEITKLEKLGNDPTEELDRKVAIYQAEHPYKPTPEDWLPEYHVERYSSEYFVVGLYHDQEHWDWITGKNDRGSLIYNVRLDDNREGAIPKNRIRKMKPQFAILYEGGHEKENKYHVFRIHDYAVMTEERMVKALYPRKPKGDYFIFRFDEEVSVGKIDINRLIGMRRLEPNFIEGAPIYLKGEELLKYKL